MKIIKKINLQQLQYLIARSMHPLGDIKMCPCSFVMTVNIKSLLIHSLKFNPKDFNVAFSQIFTKGFGYIHFGDFPQKIIHGMIFVRKLSANEEPQTFSGINCLKMPDTLHSKKRHVEK